MSISLNDNGNIPTGAKCRYISEKIEKFTPHEITLPFQQVTLPSQPSPPTN
jgi:hypothetical protein